MNEIGRALPAWRWAVAGLRAGAMLLATVPASAQSPAPPLIFGPYGDLRFEAARDVVPSAEALLQTSLLDMQHAPARRQADGTERYEILERRVTGDRAVLIYRVLSKEGDALAFAHTVCPGRTRPVDVQSLLFFEDGYWSEYPGDSALFRDFGCTRETAPERAAQEEWLSPPRFSALSPAEREGVSEPPRGSTDRAAILDALRAWNRDLSQKIPIVFVVRILRADARYAYVVAKVRQKSDGRPLPPSVWGPCEQDPEDGEVEALMERSGSGWKVLLANRCADDLLLDEETRAAHRVLVMPP